MTDLKQLSLIDNLFLENVIQDVKKYIHLLKETNHKKPPVLLFPPLNNFRRFIIHRFVQENYDYLGTISVGKLYGRRIVIFQSMDSSSKDEQSRTPVSKPSKNELKSSKPSKNEPMSGKSKLPSMQLYKPPGARRNCEITELSVPTTSIKKRDGICKTRRPDVQVYVPRAKRKLLTTSYDDETRKVGDGALTTINKSVPLKDIDFIDLVNEPIEIKDDIKLLQPPCTYWEDTTDDRKESGILDKSNDPDITELKIKNEQINQTSKNTSIETNTKNCKRVILNRSKFSILTRDNENNKDDDGSEIVDDTKNLDQVFQNAKELSASEYPIPLDSVGSESHFEQSSFSSDLRQVDKEFKDDIDLEYEQCPFRGNVINIEMDTKSSHLIMVDGDDDKLCAVQTDMLAVDGYKRVDGIANFIENTSPAKNVVGSIESDGIINSCIETTTNLSNIDVHMTNQQLLDDSEILQKCRNQLSDNCEISANKILDIQNTETFCHVDIQTTSSIDIDKASFGIDTNSTSNELNRHDFKNLEFSNNENIVNSIDTKTPECCPNTEKASCSTLNRGNKSGESKRVNSETIMNVNDYDWDDLFDDDGEYVDENLMTELVSAVGNVSIKHTSEDYHLFQTIEERSTDGECIIEIYGFPIEFKTSDLVTIFADYQKDGFQISWVDDTHALAIFSSPLVADKALNTPFSFVKTRPLKEAISKSKLKARNLILPPVARPQTCVKLARRLVSGALGVKIDVADNKRIAENKLLSDAKEKKKLVIKQKTDAWEGSIKTNRQ